MPKFNELDSAVKHDILHILLARMASSAECKTPKAVAAAQSAVAQKVAAWIDEHDGDMSPHDWLCLASEKQHGK